MISAISREHQQIAPENIGLWGLVGELFAARLKLSNEPPVTILPFRRSVPSRPSTGRTVTARPAINTCVQFELSPSGKEYRLNETGSLSLLFEGADLSRKSP